MMADGEKSWIWEQAGDYDRWTFNEWGLYYERYHDLLDLVVVRCQVRVGERVLDIGTGTGELARRFAQHRGCRVVGLDPSDAMIEEARRKAAAGTWRDVTFQVAGAPFLEIPYPDGAFDAVASTQAFHHLHERHKAGAIQEMARVLRPPTAIARETALVPQAPVGAITEMARVLRSPETAQGKTGGRLAIGDPMFENRDALEAALVRWPEDLEEEYFCYLETLEPMFRDAGLSYHAERLSRINWVVWGQRQ